jgi:hypothetical protein
MVKAKIKGSRQVGAIAEGADGITARKGLPKAATAPKPKVRVLSYNQSLVLSVLSVLSVILLGQLD